MSVPGHVAQAYNKSLSSSATVAIMDVQGENKVTEHAILTKFEKREWFLENLCSLLSFDLSQDPSDEDSRSESLRLHYMEITVSGCTRVGPALVLMACAPLLCVDKQFPRATLSLGSASRGNRLSYRRGHQTPCQSSRRR